MISKITQGNSKQIIVTASNPAALYQIAEHLDGVSERKSKKGMSFSGKPVELPQEVREVP